MNSVSYIKFIVKSKPLSEETKIKLKKAGPDRPAFDLANTPQEFNTDYYKLAKWLCGCPERRALFCYICLVTDNTRSGLWIDGVTIDIENLEELKTRVDKHQRGKKHMANNLDYALLGSNIRERSREWSSTVVEHNERVQDHQHILNKLINCVKDENEMNFVEEMNKILNESSICVASKETICDELLESIYAVCVDLIRKEIEKTDYVSVVFDDATKSGTSDLIFLVRYELHGQIHERFLKFVEKSEELSTVILRELEDLDLDDAPNKFISYSHDGLGLRYAQKENEHAKITSLYERAKFIHSYTHKLDLIIERAASTYREVKVFFANLASFSDFFSSDKYIALLDKAAEKRLLRGTKIKWNFDTQNAFIVSLHKDSINECLDQIIKEETERPSIAKAVALKNLLSDSDFNFWLDFFNKVFPNCDRLFNQLLRREGCDLMKVRQYLEIFKGHVTTMECGIDYQLNQSSESAPPNKRQRKENVAVKEEITVEEIDLTQVKQEIGEEVADESVNNERTCNELAKSVCRIIVNAVEDRFSYVDHLSTAALLQSSFFPKYEAFFPKSEVVQAASTYGLHLERLRYELHTIYNRNELSKIEGALILLQYMYKYKLTHIVPETFKLLKIICTVPMITDEPDRCFTTVTRVKELFRKACQSRNADAFIMCSLEKELMLHTPNFNDLVMEDFCGRNNRNAEFEYKRIC